VCHNESLSVNISLRAKVAKWLVSSSTMFKVIGLIARWIKYFQTYNLTQPLGAIDTLANKDRFVK
jgi:hypothetical protein